MLFRVRFGAVFPWWIAIKICKNKQFVRSICSICLWNPNFTSGFWPWWFIFVIRVAFQFSKTVNLHHFLFSSYQNWHKKPKIWPKKYPLQEGPQKNWQSPWNTRTIVEKLKIYEANLQKCSFSIKGGEGAVLSWKGSKINNFIETLLFKTSSRQKEML